MKSGNDGAPSVVFMHGWGGGVVSFLPVARKLDCFNRLLFDFRGFGESVSEKPMTLEDYAEETLALMDEIGIKKAVLVGHSFGCRVGAYIAANHPERVIGFVITDGAGLRPRKKLRTRIAELEYKIKKKAGADVSSFGSPDYKALSGDMKRTFVNIVNRHTHAECAKISCPVLIIWGKDDKETPLYMAKRFNRLIKDSALVVLGGGHFCYTENLPLYTAIVKEFVSGVCNAVDIRGD